MKTLDEALKMYACAKTGRALNQNALEKYVGLVEEIGGNELVAEIACNYAALLVIKVTEAIIDRDDDAGAEHLRDVLTAIFAQGVVTGIEMEKQEVGVTQ